MRIPVIAIIDVGKTNKKLFLFDENYRIVFERTARFLEIVDDDGDSCENIESLRLSVFDSLHEIFRLDQFDIKAINFTSYGASVVYLDDSGRPIAPLYNYLKSYPQELAKQLYNSHGGIKNFSLTTASPTLGSLNSGLQIYRTMKEKPELYKNTTCILHLPQYLSFLVSGKLYSDMTSLGCHTAIWDFQKNDYHQWIKDTGIVSKLAPIVEGNVVFPATFPGSTFKVGIGLHDSSSALIPYLLNFQEPFILISTGTWCISLNPFNQEKLTEEQLHNDCLLYMTYDGSPVKASRLFTGYEHEQQIKRIAEYFQIAMGHFKHIKIKWELIGKIKERLCLYDGLKSFGEVDLSSFNDYIEAYHALMYYLADLQLTSTKLVMTKHPVKRLFVDGGFSKNNIFMNLLALMFPNEEIYAASIPQATALGAALVIHKHWNNTIIPNNLLELKYYPRPKNTVLNE